MTTKGVIIIRDKKKKPKYYHMERDSFDYINHQKGIYGETPREYVENVNRNSGIKPSKQLGYGKYVTNISRKDLEDHINNGLSIDDIYGVDLDGKKKKVERYDPDIYHWHCAPNEIYIPAYVKDDGTYVRGYCKKR